MKKLLPLLLLLLWACPTPPGPPIPPKTCPEACPAGYHCTDAAIGCVKDPEPPQPPAGPPYAVEAVERTLRAAPEGKGFQILSGTRVDLVWGYTCCVEDLAFVFGWPGFNPAWVDFLKPLGVNGVHFRLGPYTPLDEPNYQFSRHRMRLSADAVKIGGAYEVVNGKADLDKWNPKFWAFARNAIKYAVAQGFWIEVDLIDGWGCKEGGYPHHPWNSQWNVQGEDALTSCGNTFGPRHRALVAKAVDELGSFGPVLWQDGNEIGIVGWGYNPEWTYSIQRVVREREAANNYPVHVFGTNADRSDTIYSPKVDYVTTHSGEFLTGPVANKPTLNNEHNPDYGIDGELQAYCMAKAGGAMWGLWPSNLVRADYTILLQKVQQGCDGVPMGACPYPEAPPDSATCHSYTPYGSGTKWDCTYKRHGQPILPEGNPLRRACEEKAFGGDGSVYFSLANVTGNLTIGPIGNNGQQFALYGNGSADLVCTVQSAGTTNLCSGIKAIR